VQTNIVYFDVVRAGLSAETLVTRLAGKGVRMLCSGPGRVRAVTHYGIERNDIDEALSALTGLMAAS
jgi:threonine aldolase